MKKIANFGAEGVQPPGDAALTRGYTLRHFSEVVVGCVALRAPPARLYKVGWQAAKKVMKCERVYLAEATGTGATARTLPGLLLPLP